MTFVGKVYKRLSRVAYKFLSRLKATLIYGLKDNIYIGRDVTIDSSNCHFGHNVVISDRSIVRGDCKTCPFCFRDYYCGWQGGSRD